MRYAVIPLILTVILVVSLLTPVSALPLPIYDKIFEGYKVPHKVVDVCLATIRAYYSQEPLALFVLLENGELYGAFSSGATITKVLENVSELIQLRIVDSRDDENGYYCLALANGRLYAFWSDYLTFAPKISPMLVLANFDGVISRIITNDRDRVTILFSNLTLLDIDRDGVSYLYDLTSLNIDIRDVTEIVSNVYYDTLYLYLKNGTVLKVALDYTARTVSSVQTYLEGVVSITASPMTVINKVLALLNNNTVINFLTPSTIYVNGSAVSFAGDVAYINLDNQLVALPHIPIFSFFYNEDVRFANIPYPHLYPVILPSIEGIDKILTYGYAYYAPDSYPSGVTTLLLINGSLYFFGSTPPGFPITIAYSDTILPIYISFAQLVPLVVYSPPVTVQEGTTTPPPTTTTPAPAVTLDLGRFLTVLVLLMVLVVLVLLRRSAVSRSRY